MDSKLYSGDTVRVGNSFASVSGSSEILQRALIRLAVRKGRFLPDPSLGSRLYMLRSAAAGDLTYKAKELGNEALLPMGLEVSNVIADVTETGIRLDYFLKGIDGSVVVEI